ncbi:MAG TPA: hypothetical protein PLZ36_05825 [Armatimonadota bacterium]|nr:hypothetical protein [Armatimonadota bacterium]
MKTLRWLTPLLILLAGMTLAQRPGPGPGNEPRRAPDGTQVVKGSILDVDLTQRSVRIALHLKVTDPNAPGNVPDELAQKAAVLQREMRQAEQQGENLRVQRLQRLIRELLSWREVHHVITAQDPVKLIGSRRVALATITPGMHVGLPVRVEGDAPEGQVPAAATLIGDVIILPDDDTDTARIQGRAPGREKITYMHLVGIVTAVNPLTVKVKDTTVTIKAEPQFSARQSVPITAKDLQPGLPLFAQVQLRNETEIVRLNSINVLFFQPKTPLPPPDGR